MNILSKKNIQK